MKRMALILAIALGLTPMLAAQEQTAQPLRMYFLYGNSFRRFPAGTEKHNTTIGGEYLWKGFGVGLETGLHFQRAQDFFSGCVPDRYTPCYHTPDDDECICEGSLTANGSYYFRLPAPVERFEPFLTAGYSVSSRTSPDFSRHFPNFGGGLNYWFGEHSGLRVEVRDHLVLRDGADHKPEVRFGFIARF